jgi:uncharacterized membrane protein
MIQSIKPNDQEKLVAGGLNLIAIFLPFAGPIVGFAIGNKSPFVKFHALRCLIEQIVMSLFIGTLMVLSLSWTAYNLYQTGFDFSKIDWGMVIGKTIVVWVLLGILNIMNFVNGVKDGLQAFSGKIPTKLKWTERIAAKHSGISA